MIKTILFDLDGTLVKSSEATSKLFEEITKFFSINVPSEEFRAIFREEALVNMRSLSQYSLIEKLNIGSYDLFYLNLEDSPFEQLEIEQYRITVCRNTINKLSSYNEGLTEEALILYLKENWITYYEVFNGAHETLEKLSMQYKLIMVTNGFNEIQRLKVDYCNIRKYFQDIIVASQFGWGKPYKALYQYVLKVAKSTPEECVMVGDSIENDIIGANNIGMKSIFVHRNAEENLKDFQYISNSHSVNRIEDIIGVINQCRSREDS